MKAAVGIIGGGPSGLLLAQLLSRADIASVILERQSQAHVESRIRAGVLEQGMQDLLIRAGVGERMQAEGLPHSGVCLAFGEDLLRFDLAGLTGGRQVMVYGQTELTRDLYHAVLSNPQVTVVFEAEEVTPSHYLDEDRTRSAQEGLARIRFRDSRGAHELRCDYIAGCDGFHGVSRSSVPRRMITEFERVYPFGWLGLLSDTPPLQHELVYVSQNEGFALCSMRSHTRSRYYLQVERDERLERWSDQRFWDVLASRLPAGLAGRLITGPSIEKSIAPLRSFVAEPLRLGRLFLVGDAGHIVPPTGAKGLNLAASDIHYLSSALIAHYHDGRDDLLDLYSEAALARVWGAVRFSWWFTRITHHFGDDPLERRLQQAELHGLLRSQAAQAAFAEQYVGMPFDPRFTTTAHGQMPNVQDKTGRKEWQPGLAVAALELP